MGVYLVAARKLNSCTERLGKCQRKREANMALNLLVSVSSLF